MNWYLQLKPFEKINITGTFYGDNSKPDTMDIFATRIFQDYYQASFAAAYGFSPQTIVSAGICSESLMKITPITKSRPVLKTPGYSPNFFTTGLWRI